MFIIFCVLAGFCIRLSQILPADAYKSINAWILYIALPACFLRYMPYIKWNKDVLLPSLSPVLVWIGSVAFIALYNFLSNKKDRDSVGALTLTSGLSNTAFLGFITVYYSEKEISIAVLYDQVSFTILSTLGIITAINYSGKQNRSIKVMLKKLFKFPPFIVCMIALLLPRSIDISAINPLLDKIASTIGALALFSIGLQLNFTKCLVEIRSLTAGLTYKLLIAPVLVLIVAMVTGQSGTVAKISVFEAAMPTLATAGVLADEYALNPPLANMMVGISIILSFATMGLWWMLLEWIR